MSKKYKNVSDQELNLVGHGIIKPGEELETDEEIINPNFQEVGVAEEVVEQQPEAPQLQEEVKINIQTEEAKE